MAMAPSKTAQAAGAGEDQPTIANAPATIHPELFMAACCGKSEQLKHLLDVEDAEAPAQPTAVVIVEVDRPALSAISAEIIVEVDRPALSAVSAEVIVEVDRPALSGALLLEGVTIEGDSVLHIVAASGDGDEFLECAKLIYGKAKHLLDARNKKGDTPLHCAAGAGNIKMISCLVARVSGEADGNDERVKEFLRMQNECGETALHQAVRSSNKASMGLLMSMDSELACVPQEGSSPLYLAISLGQVEIARYLFGKTNKKLSYSGPDGQNVLHAAIPRGEALPRLLEWCKDLTVQIQEGKRHRSVPLVSHLTNQRDKNGSTPLHLAASLEGWPWAEFLSKWFEHDWPKSSKTTALLLDANKYTVYQPDNEGLYPIHVAASNGSLKVVKILLERCPDCATLRDGQGRTFLHVAVDEEEDSVVGYACGKPEFASILNVQDNNGNTALHQAVHVGNLAVFNYLIRNQQVHLNLPNKEGLTPLDLSWIKIIPSEFYFKSNPRFVIWRSLVYVGALRGESRPDHIYKKYALRGDGNVETEKITNATQVMGLASVLIATVTFAAAFTLPGGSRADDHANGGTPMLAGTYSFNAFIMADTLAFIFSSLATFSLVFAGVPAIDFTIRRRFFNASVLLLRNSARSLAAAFAMGLYVVLAPVAHNIAITICVITFASLFYGNFQVGQVISVANTVHARFGIRIPAARIHVRSFLHTVLINFWSFIIIFGFPAILGIWYRMKR